MKVIALVTIWETFLDLYEYHQHYRAYYNYITILM